MVKSTKTERNIFDRLQARQGKEYGQYDKPINAERFGKGGEALVLTNSQYTLDLLVLNAEFNNVFYSEGRGIVIFD